jgi:two-component system sensor histidine kinase AdeS
VYIETWQDRNYVYFRCTDTGPGLADDNQNRAFERFWRADDSRNRVSGGSGLGLPIVKAIMQAHGGDAVILPTEGRGFSIELQLPRREEARD